MAVSVDQGHAVVTFLGTTPRVFAVQLERRTRRLPAE